MSSSMGFAKRASATVVERPSAVSCSAALRLSARRVPSDRIATWRPAWTAAKAVTAAAVSTSSSGKTPLTQMARALLPTTSPVLALLITIVSINLVGDQLRDILVVGFGVDLVHDVFQAPVLADDDVVVDCDAERLCRVDDLARHFDVGVGGRRVAGGVVVDQDQRAGVEFQGAFDHLARVDGDMVNRAFGLFLIGDQHVLAVKEEDAELFGFAVRHGGVAVVEKRIP